ncbi:tRNA adenosine(34) deaminase TadA [Lactiplantibacillus nangangensis]|uniref:tRNA-specific adenosine deaminase n=1 Tax=Lactiplantibacillus nangangensis TaxID=2559917 RepID=A0ABW1SIY4_9LACO|nr:tRNA adenosine(34) deaminase TadA [Lactiplantibacillus nangangensis]
MTPTESEKWMLEALHEAKMASLICEVPIGAVIVHDGEIIGRGHNLREHGQDATLHAEVVAIQEACEYLHSWRLEDCQIYVTLEPCIMCCGAIINARIPVIYYGARDPKAGAVRSLYQLLSDDRLNHQVEVHERLLARPAGEMLENFFRDIRKRKKAEKKARRAAAEKN